MYYVEFFYKEYGSLPPSTFVCTKKTSHFSSLRVLWAILPAFLCSYQHDFLLLIVLPPGVYFISASWLLRNLVSFPSASALYLVSGPNGTPVFFTCGRLSPSSRGLPAAFPLPL